MAERLKYDERFLVDEQMNKYNQFLQLPINLYTGDGRTHVTYYNINDPSTTISLGLLSHHQVLGRNSPLRYTKIEHMILLDVTSLTPEDTTASDTPVLNYALNGDAIVPPNTIQPHQNDMFIINHVNMCHLLRVTAVTQDGLNTNGSYKIQYQIFTSNPEDIEELEKQVVLEMVTDRQSTSGHVLTPVITKDDYVLRSRLMDMLEDMIDSYKAQFYDRNHNCFICPLNGRNLFDVCANKFMYENGTMVIDNATGNVVLNDNKINHPELHKWYMRSPFKWIERDSPIRYLNQFKYYTLKGDTFRDTSFFRYGFDVDVIIPHPEQGNPAIVDGQYFHMDVYNILSKEFDPRVCGGEHCANCTLMTTCKKRKRLERFDYVSILFDFIHGRLRSIQDLSLYTGDQLFDNALAEEIYLWSPMIIHIIRQVLQYK